MSFEEPPGFEPCCRCGRIDFTFLTPGGRACAGCLTVEERLACGFEAVLPEPLEET